MLQIASVLQFEQVKVLFGAPVYVVAVFGERLGILPASCLPRTGLHRSSDESEVSFCILHSLLAKRKNRRAGGFVLTCLPQTMKMCFCVHVVLEMAMRTDVTHRINLVFCKVAAKDCYPGCDGSLPCRKLLHVWIGLYISFIHRDAFL